MDMFNVYSEFQQLTHVAIGAINPDDELFESLKILGDKHRSDLEHLFDDTRHDFKKIYDAFNVLGIGVRQCETYKINQLPHQTLPLAPRDWFMVYGQDCIIPHQYFDCHQLRTRSLDRVFNQSSQVARWFGPVDSFEVGKPTMDVPAPYFDSANFLRCGDHIFYSKHYDSHGSKQGLETVQKFITDRHPTVTFVPVEADGHLDGSIFFVRPGLVLTTLTELPECFHNWEVIYVDNRRKKFDKQSRWDRLSPVNVKEWHWFKQANPEETAFSINAISVNSDKVLFAGFNKFVFDELEKRKVECVDLDLQTCDFWDDGLHCFTNELFRIGGMESYFGPIW